MHLIIIKYAFGLNLPQGTLPRNVRLGNPSCGVYYYYKTAENELHLC